MENTKITLIDTSQRDPIVRLFDYFDLEDKPPWWFFPLVWLLSVLVIQTPMVLYCYYTQPTLFGQVGTLRLPYFYDLNVLVCMFVLLPLLVTHVSRERREIGRIIQSLISGPAREQIPGTNWGPAQWNEFYARYNPIVGIFATVAGIVSAFIMWADFIARDLGLWQVYPTVSPDLAFNAGGYYELVLIALLWGLGFWGVGRSIVHMVVLKRIAKTRKIEINPFDVDGCGGLQMVAQATRLYQPLVLAAGLALVSDVLSKYLASGASLLTFRIILMFTVYIIIGSIAVIVPLLPFRESLKSKKQEALRKLAKAQEKVWNNVIERADDETSADVDTASMTRLESLEKIIKAMPEWPYDTKTAREYMSYVLSPIVGAAVPFGIDTLLQYLKS